MQKYFVWTTIHRKLGDIKTLVFWFRLDCRPGQKSEPNKLAFCSRPMHGWSCCYCHFNMRSSSENICENKIKNHFACRQWFFK